MKFKQKTFSIIVILYLLLSGFNCFSNEISPVNPEASSEAAALLNFLYNISGKYTLTGQHNYPNTKDRNTLFAIKYIGKTPVVFSTDWGFAKNGDKDSYLARADIVQEVIKQHHKGSIITICWHAVPPTADEPVTFSPMPDAKPDSLASVQGKLLDQQFIDILTPGTELHERWCAQVDTIAIYLKKLQDAHVPILWRPYHEMNGNWFWWGGRHGEFGTAELYRQLFDRYVNHHKLNNLIWVWSVDRPNKPEMHFSHYYPGNEYLDVLSLDVYGSDFNQSYYDSLVELSNGKPLILGEVGNPPTIEIIDEQPHWTLYVTWAGMVRNTLKNEYNKMIENPRILFMEDSAYQNKIASFRSACGLTSLFLEKGDPNNLKVDFSGKWIINEDKSILDNWGTSNLPYELNITQKENEISVYKTYIVEYDEDKVVEENLTLDGKENQSETWDPPRIMKANWSENKDILNIESKIILTRGINTYEILVNETWNLSKEGKLLSIKQISRAFWGEREITMIFDKE